MSIPQTRLRSLVLAAEDFKGALEALHQKIQAINEIEPSPGTKILSATNPSSLMHRPLESASTLAQETERLHQTWAKNQSRNRRRLRGKSDQTDLEEYMRWKEKREGEILKPPYPACRHPEICAPKGYCQADPCCMD